MTQRQGWEWRSWEEEAALFRRTRRGEGRHSYSEQCVGRKTRQIALSPISPSHGFFWWNRFLLVCRFSLSVSILRERTGFYGALMPASSAPTIQSPLHMLRTEHSACFSPFYRHTSDTQYIVVIKRGDMHYDFLFPLSTSSTRMPTWCPCCCIWRESHTYSERSCCRKESVKQRKRVE